MKKVQVLKVFCCVLVALGVAISLFACSASSGSANRYPTMDNEASMDGMFGGDSAGSVVVKPEAGEDLFPKKIIRSVSMECETKGFDAALDHILSVLSAHGGYVQSSSLKGTGYNGDEGSRSARMATYTLRVPADSLDAYLADVRANEGIRVTYLTSSSDEITSQYYDLTTRIATLETERDVLQSMLAGFTDYADIGAMLEVQERLYNVIEEIESLRTQLKIYDDKVDLSTITLTLREVLVYSEVSDPTFGERIGDAFIQSWQDFADGWQDFAVWFVGAVPTILVLVVIGGGIFAVVWGVVRRKRKGK